MFYVNAIVETVGKSFTGNLSRNILLFLFCLFVCFGGITMKCSTDSSIDVNYYKVGVGVIMQNCLFS